MSRHCFKFFIKMDCTAKPDLYKAGLKNYNLSLKAIFSQRTLFFSAMSVILVLFGSASRGEIFLFVALLWTNWDKFYFLTKSDEFSTSSNISHAVMQSPLSDKPMNRIDEFLKNYHLQQCYIHILVGLAMSYLIFFFIGGFLQWHFYVKRRDRPEEWKCQPKRFLTSENERHEIMLGACCLLVAGTVSGLASTYVINGGPLSRVYFDIHERGWLYFFASTVLLFFLQDAASYYYHRLLHYPFLFRNFHKWHHRYHSPTAFSAVAMHPVESTVFQILLLAPMFLVPLHFVSVIGCFYYLYYFGLVDHSGIDLDSVWPWQPPVRFHDDHHKYFHVNFGFNTMIFDQMHGTIRRRDRKYGEDIFYGRGAPMES